MKKLMTIVATVLVAVATQASSFTWGTNWAYGSDYGNGTANGSTWLVALAADDTTGLTVQTGGGSLNLGVGMSLLGTAAITGGSFDNGALANPSTLLGTAYNGIFVAVVTYDAADNKYGVSSTYQLSGLTVNNFDAASFVDFSNMGSGEMFSNIVAVPEPTSMALLAIGVAAFGLRRKLRK